MLHVFRNIGKVIYIIENTTDKYGLEIITATCTVGAVGGGIVGNIAYNDEMKQYNDEKKQYNDEMKQYNYKKTNVFEHMTHIGLGCGVGAFVGVVFGSIGAMFPVGCISSGSLICSIYLGDKTYKFITNDTNQ